MTVREAYKITKFFKHGHFSYPPFCISEITIREYQNTVQIGSPIYDVNYVRITKRQFLKQKEKFNFKLTYSYDDFKEYFYGRKLYLTSIGLVSEEDYFLAKDTIDNLKTIPKKELLEDTLYLSDKGKEYFYIKSHNGQVYDKKLKKQILKDSVRLVQEVF